MATQSLRDTGVVETVPAPALEVRPRTNYRWVICALLFFAATINYMDRQVLGILAPTLQEEIGWTEAQYGDIVASFQFAYAISLLVFGWIIDRIGTKHGFSLAVIWWSLAAALHAFARTPFGFAAARFGLGLGEGGNFPASIKAVAEWFPKKERALATGIFNGGTNIGTMVAALLVPFLTLNFGWRATFIIVGLIGFVWFAAWALLYRSPEKHPRVSPEELAYIRSDPTESLEKVPWLSLITYRQTWAFALGKFMTDPIWWFYLYWLPKYLDANFGVQLGALALPLVTVYLIADVGSIGGGWLSGAFIKRGWSLNSGRKAAMLVCALAIVPTMTGAIVDSMWVAVAIVSLAAAAHQGWSANLFTLASDMFPRRAVGSVVGLGGMMGSVGGILFSMAVGRWLEYSDSNYVPVFMVCGLAYVSALGIIHLIVPRLEPADIEG